MNTEEKAKVAAAGLGTEFIKCLALLPVLHSDDSKNMMNRTRMISRKGLVHPILQTCPSAK